MYRESEPLEKKSSFAAWKEIIISLSAFANKKGGKVVVGLDDQGNPTGLNIGKDTLEEMANKIKMHTDPILYPSINVKTFGPAEIVELEIPESDNKPVFAFEKAYVRVTHHQEADGFEKRKAHERRLPLFHKGKRTDPQRRDQRRPLQGKDDGPFPGHEGFQGEPDCSGQ